jgi:cell division protein FtsB
MKTKITAFFNRLVGELDDNEKALTKQVIAQAGEIVALRQEVATLRIENQLLQIGNNMLEIRARIGGNFRVGIN